MSLAGKTLKLYDTCHLHCTLTTYYVMQVRALFKNIDDVVATIKAATNKNKDRKNDFREASLPSPPVPLITQWATWRRAALYYSENISTVCIIVNNWTGEGHLVSRKK